MTNSLREKYEVESRRHRHGIVSHGRGKRKNLAGKMKRQIRVDSGCRRYIVRTGEVNRGLKLEEAAVRNGAMMKAGWLAAAVAGLAASQAFGQAYPTDGEVAGNGVNVRQSATTDGTVLLVCFKGDKLRVLSQQADWYAVELPADRAMWVHKDYLLRGTGGTAEIRGTGVNLRDGAGTEFKSLGMVSTGRKVKVNGEQGDWFSVSYLSTDKGYVNIRYVVLAGETAPAKPPEVPKPPVGDTDETEVMVKFNKAEALCKAEMDKPAVSDWKMDEAEKLFKEVAGKLKDPLLKKRSEDQIKFIAAVRQAQASMVNQDEYRKKLQEAEAAIDEEFRKKREEIKTRPAAPVYLATGRMEKLASTWLKPATYKLMDGNKIVYILYSDKVKLDQYEGKLVGIVGEVDRSLKYEFDTVRVQSVDLLEKTEKETGGKR
jgi:uncharacterized protein YgiM (DUF1202 family)